MDVAQRANVSRSLVSKVLYGDPNIRVSEEKRNKILAVAKDLGYRPNATAANLRSGKTNAVISISRFDPNNHVSWVERGAVESVAVELSLLGLELKLRPYASLNDALAGIEELASTSQCDAVVLWLPEEDNEAAGSALDRHGIPFVAVGHHEERHPDWLQVDFDHRAMMRICVEHLAGLGRKRIAYIGYSSGAAYELRLLNGVQAAVRELTGSNIPDDWICAAGMESEISEQYVSRWLDLPVDERPDGVVIGAGSLAWHGVERALALRGQRIGMEDGDLAVTGQQFGGSYLVFGNAMVFPNMEMSSVAIHVARLLGQALAPEASVADPVVRLVPNLVRAGSIRMPLPERHQRLR